MQYFPIVHERKQHFNWLIVTCVEHYFQYYIFQGKIQHTMPSRENKNGLVLSSCMAGRVSDRILLFEGGETIDHR